MLYRALKSILGLACSVCLVAAVTSPAWVQGGIGGPKPTGAFKGTSCVFGARIPMRRETWGSIARVTDDAPRRRLPGHHLRVQISAGPGQKGDRMEHGRNVLLVLGIEEDGSPTPVETIPLPKHTGGLQTNAGLFIHTAFENLELTQIHFHRTESGNPIVK